MKCEPVWHHIHHKKLYVRGPFDSYHEVDTEIETEGRGTTSRKCNMYMYKKQIKIMGMISLIGCAGIAGTAQAVGLYAGASFGQASSDIAPFGFSEVDDTDSAYSVFGGFKFNDYFALELAYTDLGKVTGRNIGPGFADSFEVELKGFVVEAVGTWPINKDFSLFGKLGLITWNSDITISKNDSFGSFAASTSKSGTDLAYGIGGQYNFN